MAEAAEANKQQPTDLKTIKQRIICQICKKQYTQPKTLPCLNSFCASCLQTIGVTQSPDIRVECPQCKKEIKVEGSDFEKLPDAFFVNKLIALHDFMQKVDGRVDVKCEKCSLIDFKVYGMANTPCLQTIWTPGQ